MKAAPSKADIALLRAQALAAEQPVWTWLEEKLGLSREHMTQLLADRFRLTPINMHRLDGLEADFATLSLTEASRRSCLLTRQTTGGYMLIITDPWDTTASAYIAHKLGRPFESALAHPDDLTAFLARHEAPIKALDSLVVDAGTTDDGDISAETLSLAAIANDANPIVRLVRSTLYDALKAGASDIHLENTGNGLSIKYRIDGVLIFIRHLEGSELPTQTISRLKVLADLDIAEHRIPQDGRLQVTVQNREVDVRVSIMPSALGEDAVLRILDRQALSAELHGLTLEGLGYSGLALERIRQLARQPYGMLLVTGPTGSGKTTTLYAAISEINDGRDKIITIEDPVEYQLKGILQIPVNEKKGLSFARGLRSILRHDPDKIMVGEIRDEETAQIAVQSALTGHLVFTTVHANNVFDVLGRFLHMDVDPYSFVSALNGIVAQRLIRCVCPACARPTDGDPGLIERLGLNAAHIAQARLMSGTGCGNCRGSGYKGRKAVSEILLLTDPLRELIANRAQISLIKQKAFEGGTRSLREAALTEALNGTTTLEEVERVTLAA